MAIGTPVKIGSATSTSGTNNIVITTSVTADVGDRIIVASNSGGTSLQSVTDSAGNTYAIDKEQNAPPTGPGASSAPVTAQLVSGGTITVTFSNTTGTKLASACKVSGLDTPALDRTAGQTSFSTASWDSTATAATTVADELIFGVSAQSGVAAVTSTATGGATEIDDITAASDSLTTTYRIVAATGTYSATGTWTSSAIDWGAVVATYKGAAVPVGVPVAWLRA